MDFARSSGADAIVLLRGREAGQERTSRLEGGPHVPNRVPSRYYRRQLGLPASPRESGVRAINLWFGATDADDGLNKRSTCIMQTETAEVGLLPRTQTTGAEPLSTLPIEVPERLT